jgi:hypothetical protein
MMVSCIHIMAVAAVYLLSALILAGLGLLVLRLYGMELRDARQLSLAPMVGWCLVIVVTQVWHLLLPVDWRAIVPLVLLAGVGAVLTARELRQVLLRSMPGRPGFLAVLLLLVLWVAYHAVTQPRFGDAQLYHLSAVQWTGAYSIVPGLGNLHDRFAFNNSYFLYVALLDTGYFAHRSHHLASGVLACLAFARILVSGWSLFDARKNITAGALYDVLFFVPLIVLAHAGYGFGSSPAPDFGIFVLGFFVSSELLRFLETAVGCETEDSSLRDLRYRLFAIVLLSVVGITVKLSFVALGFCASAVALVGLGVAAGRVVCWDVKTLLWVAGAGLLALGPWLVRGVILSGYLAYPSSFGAFPVEWRVPEANLRYMRAVLKGWARLPGREWRTALDGWQWLGPWINQLVRKPFEVVAPLVMSSVLAPALWIRIRAGKRGGAP